MRHGIDVKQRQQFIRHHVLGIHNGCHIHPSHGDNPKDMLQIPEVNGHCGSQHCNAKRHDILHHHDNRQAEQGERIKSDPGNEHDCKNDQEGQQHIHKTAGNIRNRDDFPGEINLLNEVFLCQNGCCTAGH